MGNVNLRINPMTHGDSHVYLIEVLAGLSVVAVATWMSVIWRSIRKLEEELDDHKVEAERRLTQLEDFAENEKRKSDSSVNDSRWMHRSD